ncbi:MAG: tRNA 2-thiouridine(34) synthase MnmA [candidate division WOR-3 bacterium]
MKERVYCLMSGGVDSATAAYLLKEMGYEVVGVTLLLWEGEAGGKSCCGQKAIRDAAACAAEIRIPHLTLDLREEFKKLVVEDFLISYLSGRTPNPCIVCNQKIKFGKVLERLAQLFPDEAGYIATGHYARIENSFLKKGKVLKYDQSYFLYALPKERLKRILFPIGDYGKEEVREIARKANLVTAEKPKSQEICFIPDDDYPRFLLKFYPNAAKPGPILDREGKEIGQHKGIIYYTIGQRRGVGIARGKRLYVIKTDPVNNTIVLGEEKDTYGKEALVSQLNLFVEIPDGLRAKAKIRHQDKESWAIVNWLGKDQILVRFEEPKWAITPGQSLVLYDNDTVLGGGVIQDEFGRLQK